MFVIVDEKGMKNHMWKGFEKCTLLLIICGALFTPGVANADSPPPWFTFSVESPNARYVATVEISDKLGKTDPWDWRYKLKIARKGKAEDQKLWEADYRYSGYPGSLLSNDGEYFAYVDFWYYHDHAVVRLYHRNQYWAISGQQLRIDPETLQNTVSHQLWRKGSSYFVEEGGKTVALVIGTVQGERRIELPPNRESLRAGEVKSLPGVAKPGVSTIKERTPPGS
jgi:hypothetical protein